VAALLAATEVLDRCFTLLAALAAAWLLLDLARNTPRALRRPDVPWYEAGLSRRAELSCLAIVLSFSVAYRLTGLSHPLTPAFWDSVVNTLMMDRMMKGPGFLSTFKLLLTSYQGHSHFIYRGALLPIATLLQRVLGPSLELQGYIGAVFSLSSITLAWIFGRLYRGPLFGILFAAFLSTSLIQLLWSRVGGTYLGGIPNILGVLILGFEAGRRNSILLAILGSLLTWLSLLNHYQARACFPLVYVALAAGAVRRERAFRTIAVQGALVTLVLAAVYVGLNKGDVGTMFWPIMGGDVGNQGEATLHELIQKNLAASAVRLRECLNILFVAHRGSLQGWGWGLEKGGMLLLPAIIFGVVGLAFALVRITRDFLPLAITVLGMAIPVLSYADARKLLVFDLGWQFLAAVGLYEVLHHRVLAARSRKTLVLAGGVGFALMGAWGFGAVSSTTLRAGTLEMPFRQFVLPLFGERFDSPRTFQVARLWEGWIRQGLAVVYVDTDNVANNFATYGAVAALAAGREAYFQPFYPLDVSAALGPKNLSELFGGDKLFSELLAQTLHQMGARGVVWWFERPTRWQEWLIDEFGRHGGIAQRWPPASVDGTWGKPSTYVVLEGEALAKALAALDALDIARGGGGNLCVELSPVEHWPLPSPFVNAVARVHGTADSWVVVANDRLYSGGQIVQSRGRAIAVSSSEGTELAVMDATGTETRLSVDPHNLLQQRATTPVVPVRGRDFVGANCAARVGNDWWLVDPLEGRVLSNQPTDWIPARPWVGVAGDGAERLILASADQHVMILRPAAREIEHEFPAHVWESYKLFDFGSCAVIRLLDGYIASFGMSNSLLALYTMSGDQVASLRLADAMGGMVQSGVIAIDVSDTLLVFAQVLPSPTAQVFSHAVSVKSAGCERGVRFRQRAS